MRLVGLVTAWVLLCSPALAHHSAIIFDRDSLIAFEGTVTDFEWTNPHVYIHVETPDATGELVEWEIETDATVVLTRSGWTPDTFRPGDRVAVRANPDTNRNRRHALLISIANQAGEVFTARSYMSGGGGASAATESASSVFGMWEGVRSSFLAYLQSFSGAALTPAGQAAQASFDLRRDGPEAQCIPFSSPRNVIGSLYMHEIRDAGDTILILNEYLHGERTVYMDGRGHPENFERTVQGHSIGWWEGDVLVVDTVGFADNRSAYANGVPSGGQKHVIERYELSADGRTLRVDITVEDPEYLAEPFTGSVERRYAPDLEFLDFDCDPDSSRRFTLQ